MPVTSFQAGPYSGAYFASGVWSPASVDALAGTQAWLKEGPAMASLGRHALVRRTGLVGNEDMDLAIKSFSRGSWWRDRDFRRRGSKAERSFRAAVRLAEHGVGTPPPVAYLDRWEGGRLLESYYVCVYQEGITSFRDELNRLYREDPLCRRIMTLMETVALAIADLHDAGVCHNDLGNQNILLRRRDDDAWGDVQFIDLNRAHLAPALTIRQRARDISRIDLPSDFLRVFKCMYFRHQHPSPEFHRWEEHYRRRFARHTATRKFRHPIREARQRAIDAQLPFVPRGRELWVWDDRSVQAVSTMLKRERHGYYPAANHFYIARGLVKAIPSVLGSYRDFLAGAFTRPVPMAGKIGVAVGLDLGRNEDELACWEELGAKPVLLRLYRHAPDAVNAATVDAARRIQARGGTPFFALVQDRLAVREPSRWASFVERWLPELPGLASGVEVGHAINRVKWGVWNLREYGQLLDPVRRMASALPGLPLCGPAVIDFEYHHLVGVLDQIDTPGCFAALSHHLYVDRRGAPENRQGRFASVEKFALAKAIASWSPAVAGDRLIVSEVNWPIRDTGVYSPVNSPYTIPDSHTNDPSVDEEAYANYLVRYYLLALCSGLVDQVYWWRLVARGFGLVDDTDPEWRPRPAYRAMNTLVTMLEDATFVEKMPAPAGVWALRFDRGSRPPVTVAWSHPGEARYTPTMDVQAVMSRDGAPLGDSVKTCTLTGQPVYLLGG
ncbi:MAG TPA: lipopolysaccharide kinase InaA family protein [Kiritimatiellia bacterium]|nr:lipopolysaccharide kinase InaA family protein [Kiritimatiellia bacterium]HMO99521.1 lipopolysaccharide kinase InaA family protein [Kiritimatiellia bacterium]